MSDPAIRAALRAGALAWIQQPCDPETIENVEQGIAAAVAAFLRAMPMSSLFIHGQPLTMSSLISNEELAEQVEAAAREGE